MLPVAGLLGAIVTVTGVSRPAELALALPPLLSVVVTLITSPLLTPLPLRWSVEVPEANVTAGCVVSLQA